MISSISIIISIILSTAFVISWILGFVVDDDESLRAGLLLGSDLSVSILSSSTPSARVTLSFELALTASALANGGSRKRLSRNSLTSK